MKPLCIIQAPYATRSGYGDMSRDIIRHIIELDLYDVGLVSMPWGACPLNALDENNPKDVPLILRTIQPPINLPKQPDLFIQITVPNEFKPMGKYNIGITAGIETTIVPSEWIVGANKMNLILTISEHSKRVLENTIIERRDSTSQNVLETLKLNVPVEVLHNCIDTNVFKSISKSDVPEKIKNALNSIPENFCYLFVGHWLQGGFREDRKNVGLLIHIFCETFKNLPAKKQPALILKTSGANFSIMDQEEILKKINQTRNFTGPSAPNVYLLHGELTEEEMNGLYNHPKVKAHVSFTKGEGFGRPLLEATQSNKPVIASGWSGHLDFLNKEEAILIGGELKPVEKGAQNSFIIPQSQWFNIDEISAVRALAYVYDHHVKTLNNAHMLAKKNREAFGYEVIREKTKEILDKYVPKPVVPVEFNLPTLKKAVRNG